MGEVARIHQRNIERRLRHRLEVARQKGDQDLINQLEREMQYISTPTWNKINIYFMSGYLGNFQKRLYPAIVGAKHSVVVLGLIRELTTRMLRPYRATVYTQVPQTNSLVSQALLGNVELEALPPLRWSGRAATRHSQPGGWERELELIKTTYLCNSWQRLKRHPYKNTTVALLRRCVFIDWSRTTYWN